MVRGIMGIYDRDYYQESQPGIHLGGDRNMVANLILINVGVYVVELLMGDWLTRLLALRSDLASHPWNGYQLLTYGFLHDPKNLWHIVFNMLGLWFFGRDVEWRYGRKEFLAMYLSLIVLSGLAWVVVENIAPRDSVGSGLLPYLLGASGAITGVLLLFALNFPRRTVLVWFVLPIPAWVFAVLLILVNLNGAMQREGNVAYVCHLAGAALGLVYYRTGWSLVRWLPSGLSLKSVRRRARLRIHAPPENETDMNQQVDEILRKIQQHGQDSLSSRERRILQEASRHYQSRNR
ncbi:MAG: hypothetical protein A2W31_11070 [Planctomycetes bacterium RBG_16_64_10]|nr:MAG: hypothetical protein A2W31_11070 [Planctomycetes bacterium RBG_16_64_10]